MDAMDAMDAISRPEMDKLSAFHMVQRKSRFAVSTAAPILANRSYKSKRPSRNAHAYEILGG